MELTWIIPTSMAYLGAIFLVLAVFLVFVDVPGKGVPWDRVGAWFAFLGGFGVGGGAGGWVGRQLTAASDGVLSNGQKFTAQALGVGVVGAIVVGLMLWAFARMQSKGIDAKSKIKALVVVAVLGVIGTVFSAVPKVYDWADWAVHQVGTAIISLVQQM